METKTLINLNTASEDELTQVPGIGPALAERIVAARPFASFGDVRRVSGIGSSTLDKIAPYATVEEAPFTEAEAPTIEVAPEGLDFVDIAPFEDKEEQRVAEVPADLIPLPPLPVVPPWNEEEAETFVGGEVASGALPVTAEAQVVVPPPLPETPPPLPEVPPQTRTAAPSPTPSAPRAQPKPEPVRPTATPSSEKPVTRAQLAWVSFGVFAATLLITLALTLGILVGLNGGLSFASSNDVARISREVTTLQSKVQTLEQSLTGVQTRLKNLEVLSERIQALETAKGDLQRDLDALTEQAGALNTQIQDLEQETTALNTQMEWVQAQSERVQQVMDGLRDLLNNLFPQD